MWCRGKHRTKIPPSKSSHFRLLKELIDSSQTGLITVTYLLFGELHPACPNDSDDSGDEGLNYKAVKTCTADLLPETKATFKRVTGCSIFAIQPAKETTVSLRLNLALW